MNRPEETAALLHSVHFFGFGIPARNDPLLPRMNLADLRIGLTAVDPFGYDPIQNHQIHRTFLHILNDFFTTAALPPTSLSLAAHAYLGLRVVLHASTLTYESDTSVQQCIY